MWAHIDGKTPLYENIHRMRHSNGSWVWILDRGRVSERNEMGRPIRFTGTYFQITRYMEAEALCDSLQEMAKIGGWELDIATGETKWTDEAYRLHGVPIGTPTDKVNGMGFYSIEDRPRIVRCINNCVAGIAFCEIFEFIDARGRHSWVEVMGEPSVDAHGKITKLLGTIQDITERKIAQDSLEKKSRELEEAQRAAKIGSWSFDVLTGQVRWSRQLFELFPEDPLIGAPSFEKHCETIHPDDRAGFIQTVGQCLKDGKSFRIRYRSVFPDKVLSIESIGYAKVNASGNVFELSGTCQDISDLTSAEELAKLERAKAMHNSKLASLGEMAAGVAHEINNPLTIISGNLALLSRFLSDPEKLKSKIETILRASERISKIVNGLRKFSRTSDRVIRKIHSIKAIAQEALILIDHKAKSNSVHIQIDCQTDAQIYCDEIEIEQVLINLINNGIDAVKGLQDKWVKIIISEDRGSIAVRVIDSGKGIHSDAVGKIFQPFFTTKAVGEGTGLGLSIVKGILDDHESTIELLSKEPNTCFEIRFKRVVST